MVDVGELVGLENILAGRVMWFVHNYVRISDSIPRF